MVVVLYPYGFSTVHNCSNISHGKFHDYMYRSAFDNVQHIAS